jgi:hypothetical protein
MNPSLPESGEKHTPVWQGGMTADELRAAFKSKLPRVEPANFDLAMFALGVEIGVERAIAYVQAEAERRWAQKDQSPRHWEAYPSWEHMARAISWLADGMQRDMAARPIATATGRN